MRVFASGSETYLLLNGLTVHRPVRLSEFATLLPAECNPHPDDMVRGRETEVDIGMMAIFLRHVASQIRITGSTNSEKESKEYVNNVWNHLWRVQLLSALTRSGVVCYFQSDRPAEKFCEEAKFQVITYFFKAPNYVDNYVLTEEDAAWIEQHMDTAYEMLDRGEAGDRFRNAIQSLTSIGWHDAPRARMALAWSGIEGLFGIDSEITFRLSLYISLFLEPYDKERRKELFSRVKTMYKHRSNHVHGNKIKGDSRQQVEEATSLLRRLVKKCAESNSIPIITNLIP